MCQVVEGEGAYGGFAAVFADADLGADAVVVVVVGGDIIGESV
jgi:hypothetical protein